MIAESITTLIYAVTASKTLALLLALLLLKLNLIEKGLL